jgi:putative ABC transport system permease protein
MGRDFSEAEAALGHPAALINDAARQLWPPGQSPIGQRITLFQVRGSAFPPLEVTVIGVVGNVQAIGAAPNPTVFIPYATNGLPSGLPTMIVRTRHEQPLQSADAVRGEAFSINPNVLLLRPVDLEEQFAAGGLQPRFNVWLFGGLAAIALALAAAGIYAILSYHVARRRREIGIHLALGAASGRIIWMVIRLMTRLVAIGLVCGVAATVGLARLAKSQVVSLPDTDSMALVVAVVVLTGVAACACYIPARRAARVDPLTVLRLD